MALFRIVRKAWQLLPQPKRRAIYTLLYKTGFGRQFLRGAYTASIDAYLLSYPKCGRTWLRLMIGKALALHYGLSDSNDILELEPLTARLPGVPLIRATHDDTPHEKSAAQIATDKSRYKYKKIIFLVRDVRDVIVSLYFQKQKRRGVKLDDIRTFVCSDVGGLSSVIAFYNIWAQNRQLVKEFLLVKYEDLHANPESELRRVLDFLGLQRISDDVVRQAVAFTSFDNMRQMETSGRFDNLKLKPGDNQDPESFKTRRGKVGGYTDYLPPDLIEYVNDRVRRELSPTYGYGVAPPTGSCSEERQS